MVSREIRDFKGNFGHKIGEKQLEERRNRPTPPTGEININSVIFFSINV